jgi:hypothetical protein
MVNVPGCGKRSLPFFQSDAGPLRTATSGQSSHVNSPATVVPADQNIVPSNPVSNVAVVEAERIAYTAMDGSQWELFSMAPDGSDVQRLTPKNANAWFPVWSPSGKQLAFLSNMNNGKVNLFVAAKGSREFKQLTFFDDLGEPRESPSQAPFTWSPRSDQIALIYHQQIILIDLEKLSQTTLTEVEPSFKILSVDWAPRRDNRYVAFMLRQGEKYHSLWLVNPRLHDTVQLSSIHNTAGPISWSSDANSVAFFRGNVLAEVAFETQRAKTILQEASPEFGGVLSYAPIDGNNNILMLAKKVKEDSGFRVALASSDKPCKDDSDSGTLKFLTEPGAEYAVWSPDATKIMYILDGAIWVMDATGANKKRISLAGAKTPAWTKK